MIVNFIIFYIKGEKQMKKIMIISIALILLVCAFCLCGISYAEEKTSAAEQEADNFVSYC